MAIALTHQQVQINPRSTPLRRGTVTARSPFLIDESESGSDIKNLMLNEHKSNTTRQDNKLIWYLNQR